MSFACEALSLGSMGVTRTTFEVPGGGFVDGIDLDEPLKRYRRKTKTPPPPRMYGRRLRRLRRRYVVERGLYGCGCEVLRGYGNCIMIAVAFGGVYALRGCAMLLYRRRSYAPWQVQLFRSCCVSRLVFSAPSQLVFVMCFDSPESSTNDQRCSLLLKSRLM